MFFLSNNLEYDVWNSYTYVTLSQCCIIVAQNKIIGYFIWRSYNDFISKTSAVYVLITFKCQGLHYMIVCNVCDKLWRESKKQNLFTSDLYLRTTKQFLNAFMCTKAFQNSFLNISYLFSFGSNAQFNLVFKAIDKHIVVTATDGVWVHYATAIAMVHTCFVDNPKK